MLGQISKERVLIEKSRKKFEKLSKPEVSIILPTNKLKYVDNIFKNYERCNYPFKELIIILNNNKLNLEKYKIKSSQFRDIRIFQLDESCTLGECLNFGIEQSKYNYISKMDDDDYYGANYLNDIMNVFNYSDADVTGKATYFTYFETNNSLNISNLNYENKYTRSVAGGTLLIKKEVFKKVKFKNLTCGEDSQFLKDCSKLGVKIYSSDKYNYVYMKHNNLAEHTWKISSKSLMNSSRKILITENFIPIITV